MMTKSIVIGVGILCIIAFSGCGKNGPLYKKKSADVQKINFNQYSIYYTDQRHNVNYNGITDSIVTSTGRPKSVTPAVDTELKTITDGTIGQFKAPGEKDIIIEVCLLEGYAEFLEGAVSETEKVLCRLKVNVMDKETSTIIDSSIGECWGKRTSLDASDEMLRTMFYKAYEMALADALNKLQTK